MSCDCRKLERENEQLRETVLCLQEQIGERSGETDLARIQEAFRLPRQCCRVLMELYQAKGNVVNSWALLDMLSPEIEESKVVQVYVTRIRNRLGKGSVVNSWGRGYRLSPEVLDLIAGALK